MDKKVVGRKGFVVRHPRITHSETAMKHQTIIEDDKFLSAHFC
jgi:hypothetical protein